MRVLLIEPYTELRVMLRGVLKAMGVRELHEPRNTMEAINILTEKNINIFICSREARPFTAELMLKMIRNAEEERIRTLRSIISLGDPEEADTLKLFNLGADALLQKPFSADDVKTLIMKTINQRQPFIETTVYTGPCRRRNEALFEFDDRRDEMFNPGRAEYPFSLRKLAFRIMKIRTEGEQKRLSQREQKLKAKGGIIIDRSLEEINLSVHHLIPGMTLTKALKTREGTLIMPTLTELSPGSIRRIQDLIKNNQITDGIWVQKGPVEDRKTETK